jgi:catechol 2,3-dioxygenase-like lactoylglutathione lyase family enzyme
VKAPAFDHIGLPVRDLDRSRAFYVEVLGLSVLWEGPDTVMLRAGGRHDLALQRHPRVAPPPHLHFGFKVACGAEVVRWEGHLRDHGVRGVEAHAGGGSRSVYFLDPDGYRLEIYFDPEHAPRVG